MKNLIFIIAFLSSASIFANSNCYVGKELNGRNKISNKFMNSQTNAALNFEEFCKENATKITCETQVVQNSEVKASKTKLIKGHPCGEIIAVKDKENTTTLYFFDAAKK